MATPEADDRRAAPDDVPLGFIRDMDALLRHPATRARLPALGLAGAPARRARSSAAAGSRTRAFANHPGCGKGGVARPLVVLARVCVWVPSRGKSVEREARRRWAAAAAAVQRRLAARA